MLVVPERLLKLVAPESLLTLVVPVRLLTLVVPSFMKGGDYERGNSPRSTLSAPSSRQLQLQGFG